MTHSQALRLALDALGKWSSGRDMDAVELNDLIAALEQTEQEPVAWIMEDDDGERLEWAADVSFLSATPTFPLYTAPPRREWRGLTEEEISALFPSHLRGDYKDLIPYSFARAIEAALKERNA